MHTQPNKYAYVHIRSNPYREHRSIEVKGGHGTDCSWHFRNSQRVAIEMADKQPLSSQIGDLSHVSSIVRAEIARESIVEDGFSRQIRVSGFRYEREAR